MNSRQQTRPGLFVFTCLKAALIFVLGVTSGFRSQADVTLEARLTPTIVIDGPLGSLQQVQYSTNLADTNAWMDLSVVRLDTVPKHFFDTAGNGANRFYRSKFFGVADADLVWIPPGTFLMGSPTNEAGRSANEGPQTLVTLTEGFLMGRYEVRYPEMKAFVTDYIGNPNGAPDPARFAANEMSWTNAMLYCALRTAHERAQGMIPSDWAYRLPTEAEWEYACRAGTSTPFHFGNELRHDGVRSDANFDGTFPYPTNLVAILPISQLLTNVGSFTPNAFGLYDMHGSVGEHCFDTVGSIVPLPGGAITNPVAAGPGPNGIMRGGKINDPATACRAASRRIGSIISTGSGSERGFRVVLSPTNAAVLPHP
jgi:formylglycine-generating enzyme required for sulfatase activity